MEKNPSDPKVKEIQAYTDNFVDTLRTAIHNTFRYGQGTRDMCGPTGFTTEDFIDKVAWRLDRYLNAQGNKEDDKAKAPRLAETDLDVSKAKMEEYDQKAILKLFTKYDKSGDGRIDFKEFTAMLIKMGVAPRKS